MTLANIFLKTSHGMSLPELYEWYLRIMPEKIVNYMGRISKDP
jgi:hypothetical protein